MVSACVTATKWRARPRGHVGLHARPRGQTPRSAGQSPPSFAKIRRDTVKRKVSLGSSPDLDTDGRGGMEPTRRGYPRIAPPRSTFLELFFNTDPPRRRAAAVSPMWCRASSSCGLADHRERRRPARGRERAPSPCGGPTPARIRRRISAHDHLADSPTAGSRIPAVASASAGESSTRPPCRARNSFMARSVA